MASIDSKKKRVYASNVALYTVFVIGAIVVVNLLSTRMFGRLDLTAGNNYTLSGASRDVVKKLPDYLTIKAFISSDLPPELKAVSRYVRDTVDEYKSASNGKLTWEAIDPKASSDETEKKRLTEEANKCNVRQLEIQVMRTQKLEVGAYYLGLCFQYGGQTEAIPEIAHAEGLEYQISSIIKRMTQKKKKVAFTTGHGELEPSQGMQALQGILKQEFDVSTVNPSQGTIGDDVDALVVAGPKQAFDDKGRHEIDRFLMTGKNAIFLIDGMAMSTPQGMGGQAMAMPKVGQANAHGLDELLAGYGFKIGQDFVFDSKYAQMGLVEYNGRMMPANVPMYMGVPLTENKDLPISAGLRGLILPYASSVELTGPLAGGKPAKGKLWKLAESSPSSWKQTGFFVFQPTQPVAEGKEKGTYGLGYVYEGPLKSAFAPATQNAGMSTPDAQPASESKRPVRLVVIGDSDFTSDQYVSWARHPLFTVWATGAQLMVNAVGWTLEDEALTPVRAKTMTARPLDQTSDSKAVTLKWLNVGGVPLVFCLYGLVRWRLRKARRQEMKLA